jgi:hypothetical protein
MGVLLKCVGMWFLILWQKESLRVLCANNDTNQKPFDTDLVDLFSSKNNTDKLEKNTSEVEPKCNSFLNITCVEERNTAVKNTVNMEGGGDVMLEHDVPHFDVGSAHSTGSSPLDSSNSSISVTDRGNRSSGIVPRKGVTYKPKIVARKGVGEDHSTEENSSGMTISGIENTDENMEKDNIVPSKKCVCCSSNILNVSAKNESDNNCIKCCNMTNNGRNTSNTVRNTSNMTDPVNQLHIAATSSALNVTTQDETWQNTSDSVKQDKHNPSTLNSTATSAIPSARNKKPLFTLDAANDSPANLSFQSPSHSKGLNRTDYVVPVVCAILAVPLFIVSSIFLYRKGSEFWERRHYRRMDFLIDGMYND